MSLSKNAITSLVVSLALFMDAIDTTIINTAIPSMARDFHAHPIDLKLALISYLISLAIFIPISGWLADRFGIKRIFLAALGLFLVSSFACGYSESLTQLVVARAIQGFGGALILPLGRLIILKTYPRHKIVEALNRVIMIVSIGLMLGPFAGGVITYHFSWPWIFWINIPIGCLALYLGVKNLEAFPTKKVHAFDYLGFVLFAGGLATLTFSLSYFSESFANPEHAIYLFGISFLSFLSYTLHAYRTKYVIVNVSLLKKRTFFISIWGNLFSRISFGGLPFLLPLLFQVGLQMNPQESGILMMPLAIGIFFVKSISVALLRFIGYRRLLLVNTVMVAASVFSFSFVTASTPGYLIAIFTFCFGFVIAMQYTSMNSLAYADLAEEELSDATSLVSTFQQLSQSFGVALCALILQFYLHVENTQQLNTVTFHKAFVFLALITFVTLIIFTKLKPSDGQQMILKKPVN